MQEGVAWSLLQLWARGCAECQAGLGSARSHAGEGQRLSPAAVGSWQHSRGWGQGSRALGAQGEQAGNGI